MVRALTAVISVKGPDDPLVQKAVMISWIVAAATMILGNTLALLQNNLKRLLAYSSIAHAGYLMIGVTVAFANGSEQWHFYYGCESVFFYLVAYALMTPGRIRRDHRVCGLAIERWKRSTTSPVWARTQPWPALAPCRLPPEPQRHSPLGRVLGQVRDLRLAHSPPIPMTIPVRSTCWQLSASWLQPLAPTIT